MTANQDSSPNAASASDENSLKDEPLRLVVLSKEAATVKSTVSFLNRRGVEVFATTVFQEAVDKLATDWARFVLLSVNFPHPKIELVPQLLSQSFDTEVLLFAETQDRKSNSKLTASKGKHIIFGSVSGPVVLMRLNQILKEALQQPENGTTAISRSGLNNGDEGSIHLKDLNRSKRKEEGLKRLMAALGDDLSEVEPQQKKQSAPVIIQKGNRGQLMLSVPPPTELEKGKVRASIEKGHLKPAQPKITEAQLKPVDVITEQHPQVGLNKSGSGSLLGVSQESVDILERCMRAALKECCGWPKDHREALGAVKTVSALVFKTAFFRGSTLIAIGRGDFDHTEMLKSIETEFIFQLIQSGVDIGVGELERYEITPASAASHAFVVASTAAVTRSENLEVGMAVIDVVPEVPELVVSPDFMIAVKPDSIEPEQQLKFELFLHLPLNGRYVKIVREGFAMSTKQSVKLSAKKDTSVYLTKAASAAFREHASIKSIKSKIVKKTG